MAKLALKGGKPVRTKEWPAWPVYGRSELQAVRRAIQSRRWGGGVAGSPPEEAEFERRFAEYLGCKYCTTVANGTAALQVALLAAGIGEGDEVIVPAISWLATASAPLMVGAKPVFVDVHPDTICLDASKLEEAITPRTRAIIPVHNYGTSPDMDEIMRIARKHKLVVIEDCARAHGFRWKGKAAGAIGHMGCFSFQQGKFMTAGEGGAITTDNRRLFERARSIKDCGRVWPGDKYSKGTINWFNLRMTNIQSAILLCQLERLEQQLERRARNAEYLIRQLEGIEGVEPIRPDPRLTKWHPWPFAFKVDNRAFGGAPVERIRQALNAEGIPCGGIDGPLYKTLRPVPKPERRCPVAERLTKQVISLPQSMFLATRKDMDDIVEAVAKVQENADELKG